MKCCHRDDCAEAVWGHRCMVGHLQPLAASKQEGPDDV